MPWLYLPTTLAWSLPAVVDSSRYGCSHVCDRYSTELNTASSSLIITHHSSLTHVPLRPGYALTQQLVYTLPCLDCKLIICKQTAALAWLSHLAPAPWHRYGTSAGSRGLLCVGGGQRQSWCMSWPCGAATRPSSPAWTGWMQGLWVGTRGGWFVGAHALGHTLSTSLLVGGRRHRPQICANCAGCKAAPVHCLHCRE